MRLAAHRPGIDTMGAHRLDGLNVWVLFFATVAVLALASELGHRLGRAQRGRVGDEMRTHAGVVLGSLFALLSLLLAFTVNIAEGRFAARRQLVLQEANSIGTTYRRAELLSAPHDERVQSLLRRYVSLRTPTHAVRLPAAVTASEAIHEALWSEAVAANDSHPHSPIVAVFAQSLNQLIDLHEERLTVALLYRIPQVFVWGLYVLSLLSATVLGYTAGLGGQRPAMLFSFVVLAIALVITLAVELDRPMGSIFKVDPQALRDVQKMMSEHR